MKNIKTTLLSVALVLTVTAAHAQYPFTIKGAAHTLLENDSVVIPSPQTFRGAVEWQKSYDSIIWVVVKTAEAVDTLEINADSVEIYRLAVTEGTCNPIYSDTIIIGDADNVNDLLAQGFEVNALLEAGVPLDNFVNDNVPVEALLDAGLTPDTLFKSGVTATQLAEAGITLDELLATNIPIADIYEAGFLVGTLKQHGVDSLDLVAAGLIGTMRDADGNWYPWVKIGNQIWMAENLRTTHFRNGGIIQTTSPANADISTWPAVQSRLQWAYNGDENNVPVYGRLYTWYTAEGDSLCPTGWHVPIDAEWTELANFLGGYSIAGGKMKSVSNLWIGTNVGATNESGFNGLPSGFKIYSGGFAAMGNLTRYLNYTQILMMDLGLEYANFGTVTGSKKVGLSVRCIKD